MIGTIDALSNSKRLVGDRQSLFVLAGLIELKHLAIELDQVFIELELGRRRRGIGTLTALVGLRDPCPRLPQRNHAAALKVKRPCKALPLVLKQGFEASPIVALGLLDPLRGIKIENSKLWIERAARSNSPLGTPGLSGRA